jgi:hypothetical protein
MTCENVARETSEARADLINELSAAELYLRTRINEPHTTDIVRRAADEIARLRNLEKAKRLLAGYDVARETLEDK